MPRALAVFAHPDDLEFLAGGTFLLWAREGWETGLVLATSGSGGSTDPGADRADLARLREDEAREAATLLGIQALTFLRREDGVLVADLELRRDIAREIRRFRPDVVVTQDPRPRVIGRHYLNHPDHRAAGEAALAAIYPAAKKPLVFPELLAEGHAPHLVAEVYLAHSPEPDLWVDIADVMEEKVAAVLRHRSQFPDQGVVDFIHGLGRDAARGTPLSRAESFRTVELKARSYIVAEEA